MGMEEAQQKKYKTTKVVAEKLGRGSKNGKVTP